MKRFKKFQKVRIKGTKQYGRVITELQENYYLVKVGKQKREFHISQLLDEEFLKDIFSI